MNSFSLIRTKWSNEHIMAALVGVLVLYLIPEWIGKPILVLQFVILLAVALFLDSAINFYRYKRPICAVSAAVTTGIITVLTQGVSLWGQLLAIIVALVLGKHIFGGTGKNIVNPALVGIIFVSIFYPIEYFEGKPSYLILPAVLLSLLFIRMRPFAAVGFMIGMAIALSIKAEGFLSLTEFYSVIFLGSIVLTDPVTVTDHPTVGSIGGLLTGFFPSIISNSMLTILIAILILNVISRWADELLKYHVPYRKKVRIRKILPYQVRTLPLIDMVLQDESVNGSENSLDSREILKRIKENEVYGQGGAAFSTYDKINSLLHSKVDKKHFIINGAECDPGLTHDQWILLHKFDQVSKGIHYLAKCIRFDTITLAVKHGEDLNEVSGVAIRKIPDYYPVGAERFLIKELFHVELSKQQITSEEGYLILNVQTIYSIYEAVWSNQKIDSKYITVADLKNNLGYVVNVKLGENVQSLRTKLGQKSGSIFCGGGAMQCHHASEEDFVDKTTNFIAFSDFPRYKESPLCSQCGLCKKYCPMGIPVNRIVDEMKNGAPHEKSTTKINLCMQCGNCSRVCLAGRNLAAKMKEGKRKVEKWKNGKVRVQ